jgi:hypothetical protein
VQFRALYDHEWNRINLLLQTYHYSVKAGNTTFSRGGRFPNDYAVVKMNAQGSDRVFTSYAKESIFQLAMENPSIWEFPLQSYSKG